MLPATGSTITAAISPPRRPNSSRTRVEVVERRRVSVSARERRRHARGCREAENVAPPEPALHEQAVGVAVIAAVELHDTSRPWRRARGGCALIAASVPELTSRTISIDGHARRDRLRQLDLELGRRAVARAPRAPPRRSPRPPPAARGRGSAVPRSRRSRCTMRPSTSRMRAPSPRAMNSGSPPTPRNARTGLFTPPGMTRLGRAHELAASASSRAPGGARVHGTRHLDREEVALGAVPPERRHRVDPAARRPRSRRTSLRDTRARRRSARCAS